MVNRANGTRANGTRANGHRANRIRADVVVPSRGAHPPPPQLGVLYMFNVVHKPQEFLILL